MNLFETKKFFFCLFHRRVEFARLVHAMMRTRVVLAGLRRDTVLHSTRYCLQLQRYCTTQYKVLFTTSEILYNTVQDTVYNFRDTVTLSTMNSYSYRERKPSKDTVPHRTRKSYKYRAT
jgi:hypothetical protein